MFEVVATQRSRGPSGFSLGLLVLSAGLHALVLLGASLIPTRTGTVPSRAVPAETVTFLRLPQLQQAPALQEHSASLTSRSAAALTERTTPPRTESPPKIPVSPSGISLELPDVTPVALIAGAILPDGADASAAGVPRALARTAEALSIVASARSGRRSTDELGDPSRISERPTLLNEAKMRRTWRALYPDSLNTKGVEGQALASFIINTDGSVDPASIYLVSASHPQFRDATAMGVLELRFSPARQRGRAVRVRVELPIRWTLPGW